MSLIDRRSALKRIRFPSRLAWFKAAGLSTALASMIASGRLPLSEKAKGLLAEAAQVEPGEVLRLVVMTTRPYRTGGAS